ncbi:MAG: type II toxin-antitoxin system HicB family antitoxin [Candidatus Vogelbacteria bacterium]|nr:type II toxin-antitoxin system HicB family antitoxin [Candidatus Vogelbacteria bacterium]
MKSIIQFSITKEPEGYYVASGIGHPIVTQADSLDELQSNISEAVQLYLKDEDLAELGLSSHPSLLMSIEIPQIKYA